MVEEVASRMKRTGRQIEGSILLNDWDQDLEEEISTMEDLRTQSQYFRIRRRLDSSTSMNLLLWLFVVKNAM